MPFKKLGTNSYQGPSGKKFDYAQVKMYYANGGKFPGQRMAQGGIAGFNGSYHGKPQYTGGPAPLQGGGNYWGGPAPLQGGGGGYSGGPAPLQGGGRRIFNAFGGPGSRRQGFNAFGGPGSMRRPDQLGSHGGQPNYQAIPAPGVGNYTGGPGPIGQGSGSIQPNYSGGPAPLQGSNYWGGPAPLQGGGGYSSGPAPLQGFKSQPEQMKSMYFGKAMAGGGVVGPGDINDHFELPPPAYMGDDPDYPNDPTPSATIPPGGDPNVFINHDPYSNNNPPPSGITDLVKPPGVNMPPNQQPMPTWMRFMPPVVQAGYHGFRMAQRIKEMYQNYQANHPRGGGGGGSGGGGGGFNLPGMPPGYNPFGGLPPGFTESNRFGGGAPIFTPPGFTGPGVGPGGYYNNSSTPGGGGGLNIPGGINWSPGGSGGNLGTFGGKIAMHESMPQFGGLTLTQVSRMFPGMLPGLKRSAPGIGFGPTAGTAVGPGGGSQLKGYTGGGMVRGPGPIRGMGTDTVPAALTPGEVVMNQRQLGAIQPRPGQRNKLRGDQLAAIAMAVRHRR